MRHAAQPAQGLATLATRNSSLEKRVDGVGCHSLVPRYSVLHYSVLFEFQCPVIVRPSTT